MQTTVLRQPTLQRSDIVDVALRLKGVRYVNMGRSLLGVDCIGVVMYVASQFGIEIEGDDWSYVYSLDPDGLHLRKRLSTYLNVIDSSEAGPGDVVLMLGTRTQQMSKHPQHVGIILPGKEIIHATNLAGKVIVSPFAEGTPWRKKCRGYFTWPFLA